MIVGFSGCICTLLFVYFCNVSFYTFGCKRSKRVLVTFISSSLCLQCKERKKLKQRRRETCNRLRCSCEHKTKLMYAGRACTFSLPIVSFGYTAVVKIRTTLRRNRVAVGNHRLRKLVGFADAYPFNPAAAGCPKQFCVSFFFWFNFLLSLPQNQRKKKMNKKNPLF